MSKKEKHIATEKCKKESECRIKREKEKKNNNICNNFILPRIDITSICKNNIYINFIAMKRKKNCREH